MTTDTVPQFVIDIIAQLGGKMIFKMAFRRSLYDVKQRQITFEVARDLRSWTRDRITHVRVTVEPSDTYRVEMLAVRGRATRVVDDTNDLYCDQLQAHVERLTGLVLTLAPPVRVVSWTV